MLPVEMDAPPPMIIEKLDSCVGSSDSISTASLTEDEQAPEVTRTPVRRSVRFDFDQNQVFKPSCGTDVSEEQDHNAVWYSRQEFATFKKDTLDAAKAISNQRQIMDFSNTMSFASLLETLHDNCTLARDEDELMSPKERQELITQYGKDLSLKIDGVTTSTTMIGLERLVLTGIQVEKLQRRADLNKLVREIQAYAKNVNTSPKQRAKVLGREVRKVTESSRLFAHRLAQVQGASIASA